MAGAAKQNAIGVMAMACTVAESGEIIFHVKVGKPIKPIRESVAEHRERLRAAGRMLLTTDLPMELIEAIDKHKAEIGVRGRTPIIEDALRVYLKRKETQRA